MSDRLMGFILTLILMAVIWMLLPYIIAIAIKVFWFVGGVVWVVSTLWEWSKP
jgi:succinate-acetate transporter protein